MLPCWSGQECLLLRSMLQPVFALPYEQSIGTDQPRMKLTSKYPLGLPSKIVPAGTADCDLTFETRSETQAAGCRAATA